MKLVKLCLLWIAVLMMGYPRASNAWACITGKDKDAAKPAIRLILRTEAERWHVGKPSTVTVYLQNMSQQNTYYVGSVFFGLRVLAPFHYIELRITDMSNKEVGQPSMSITADLSDKTVKEKIAQAYTTLGPNMIHGLSLTGLFNLKPGRYKLTAIYHEVEAISWKDSERESLPFPVLIERLVSNPVYITVAR